MTNALAQLNNNLSMWEDSSQIEEIRSIFAPTLTESEFKYFVSLGKASGLNPFFKELWAVKYGKDKDGNILPAQIFVGLEGYRKGSRRQPEYDYHHVDAVYENDTFMVTNGEVSHAYNLKDRGKLRGAYCTTKLRNSSKAHYVFVELEEYSTGQAMWAEISYKDNKYGGKYKVGGKPATMIKKVAECQCLRMAFDIFKGTYSEYEMQDTKIETNERIIQGETQTERLKNMLANNSAVASIFDGTIVTTEIVNNSISNAEEFLKEKKESLIEIDNQLISSDTLSKMEVIMSDNEFDDDRKKRVLERFKVENFSDLTESQAKVFLVQFGVNY